MTQNYKQHKINTDLKKKKKKKKKKCFFKISNQKKNSLILMHINTCNQKWKKK